MIFMTKHHQQVIDSDKITHLEYKPESECIVNFISGEFVVVKHTIWEIFELMTGNIQSVEEGK